MTDCNSCRLSVPVSTGDTPSHGRPPEDLVDRVVALDILESMSSNKRKPPRDLEDRVVDVAISGELGTGSLCRSEYNKLLTSEVYKVVQLTSALYPLEIQDSIEIAGILNSVDYWGMPHDEINNTPIFSKISIIDTVRYLDLGTEDQLDVGPVLGIVKVVDTIRRLNISIDDSLAVGPVLDKVTLRLGAGYVDYTKEDSLNVSVLLNRIAVI